MSGEQSGERIGLVLLHEVSASGEDLQPRARDASCELAPTRERQPGIGAPQTTSVGTAIRA